MKKKKLCFDHREVQRGFLQRLVELDYVEESIGIKLADLEDVFDMIEMIEEKTS